MPLDVPAAIGTAGGFVAGITLHEYATAFVADRLGDKVPRMRGRISLSFKRQAYPLGSVILPIVFVVAALFRALAGVSIVPFGYGKRHDLNPLAFRHPRRDTIMVSLAGPIVTLGLAILLSLLSGNGPCGFLQSALDPAVYVLVTMTVVELVPLPGRDGARVLATFLAPNAAAKIKELEHYDVAFVLLFIVLLTFLAFQMVAAVLAPILGGASCLL